VDSNDPQNGEIKLPNTWKVDHANGILSSIFISGQIRELELSERLGIHFLHNWAEPHPISKKPKIKLGFEFEENMYRYNIDIMPPKFGLSVAQTVLHIRLRANFINTHAIYVSYLQRTIYSIIWHLYI
jgi:hypothetical protein